MSKQRNQNAGTVTLSFNANMQYVRPVRHFISALCALAEYAEDETDSIALVVTEILNNSIEHGCRSVEDEVVVTMFVTQERFQFEVLDSGKGGSSFAATALDKAGQMPDLEEPRGRGLFLIKTYMDEMFVNYDPARGTRLRVSKTRET